MHDAAGMPAWRWGLLLVVVAVAPAARATDGGALFARECASCHGRTGRGDGPDARLFVPPPRDLRSGFLDRYTAGELVARIRDGRRLPLTVDPEALRTRIRETDALVAHVERLPMLDWGRLERGEEIFVDRCESCHGPFGHPADGHRAAPSRPRDLSDAALQRRLADPDLVRIVREGAGEMPGLGDALGTDDAAALVAFVRLLSPGFEWYRSYCAGCHGDDGRGAGEPSLVPYLPRVALDARYFAGRDRDHLRTAVWHMVADARPIMPHLRDEVSQAEGEAIVAWLRAEAPPVTPPRAAADAPAPPGR